MISWVINNDFVQWLKVASGPYDSKLGMVRVSSLCNNLYSWLIGSEMILLIFEGKANRRYVAMMPLFFLGTFLGGTYPNTQLLQMN